MSDRWVPIRRLAAAARETANPAVSGAGLALARAALEARDIEVLRLAPADPLLRGARAVYDTDFAGYDRTLTDIHAAFPLAHELGHAVLHGQSCRCTAADIDEGPTPDRLPYGAGSVEVYNPYQQRELEANMFAAAFLLPADELRARFLAGDSFEQLATDFAVSPTATLNALATCLLLPPAPAPEPPAERRPLDPSQHSAAVAEMGPVLISAGPGTGKTTALVGRVAHLLERGVPAGQILAVTFSNRATHEMRERLREIAPMHAHELTVSTFHAFCLELLRRYHESAGLPADFAIADQVEVVVLLERHLGLLDLDRYFNLTNPTFSLTAIARAISRAKDELVTPARYAELANSADRDAGDDERAGRAAAGWAEVARVYAVYERLLDEHGLVDFGGLIMRTVELLRRHPDILDAVRRQYVEILVDEYQDMNRASAFLLQLLVGTGQGLWVVGDVRQAIYRFRGASPANITNFMRDFPGGRILPLDLNYRSDPRLVALFTATATAMNVPEAPLPTWEAFWPGEPPPRIWVAEADDEEAEGNGLAAEVLRRVAGGCRFKDQAVLVRTHAQANAIVAALTRAGVPVLYLGDLFARSEVRDLLALVSLVADGDGAGLMRVGAMPEHALPRHERICLIRYAREHGVPFSSALGVAPDAGLAAESVAVIDGLRAALEAVGWQADPWQFLARYLFGHGGLVRRLLHEGTPEALQQLMAIGQLLAVARAAFERPGANTSNGSGGLRAFLTYVRLLVAMGEHTTCTPVGADVLDAVRILTVHASKGLEFPVVYLTNLADKRFPSLDRYDVAPPPPGLTEDETDDSFGEEACLFFVGITRAKNELILSHATRYGKSAYLPSPLFALVEPFFAGEVPERLRWMGTPPQDPPIEEMATPIERTLDMAEVELYMRCPRRYEYRYVLGIHEHGDITNTKRLTDCIRHTLRQIQTGQQDGTLTDEDGAQAVLTAEWERSGPRSYDADGRLRSMAQDIVTRYWSRLSQHPPRDIWRAHLDVEIAGATVRIPIDASEMAPDGSIRLIRRRLKKSDKDRKAPRLALLRSAAAAELGARDKVSIAMEYLATGETNVVNDAGRWEKARVEAIEAAIAGILGARYTAEPTERRDCMTCPYWTICPA